MQPTAGKEGKTVYIFGPGHMTEIATIPIYRHGKHLKNLLLQNHLADCLETWYVASGELVLYTLYTLRGWVDLDLFFGKVRFGP